MISEIGAAARGVWSTAAGAASSVGTTIWNANPLALGLAFGVGAGAYAAGSTFTTTDGGIVDKAKAGATSGLHYAGYGGVGMAVGLTAMNFLPTRTGGYMAGAGIRRYAGSVGREYAAGASTASGMYGLRSVASGVGRVVSNKPGVMIGFGAAIGAAIGSKLDPEHEGRGAARGAIIGGGAGLALNVGLRGSKLWKGIGPVGRAGALAGLTLGVFGAAQALSRPKYSSMDIAQPEDYGLKRRLDTMGAEGDLVFGLHNKR